MVGTIPASFFKFRGSPPSSQDVPNFCVGKMAPYDVIVEKDN